MQDDLFNRVRAVLEYQHTEDTSDVVTKDKEDALMRRVARHIQEAAAKATAANSPQSHYATPADSSPPPRRASRHRVRAKPTPYEVWSEQWGAAAAVAPKPQPARRPMHQEDWERFTGQVKEMAERRANEVQHLQHERLADELRGLSFRPELNKHSQELCRQQRALLDRQDELVKAREEALSKQREEKAEKEMKECTFTPRLCSREKSERYLQRAARAGRKVDFTEFLRQRRVRREQRRKELQEVEEQQLTFRPALTRMTFAILKKAKREGRVRVDPGTQTTRVLSQGLSRGKDDGQRERGGQKKGRSFEPRLTARSAKYAPAGRGDVHSRLYESARGRRDREEGMGGSQVLVGRESMRSGRRGGQRKAAWGAETELHARGVTRRDEMDASDEPVLNVVRWQERYQSLVMPLDPWVFGRQGAPHGMACTRRSVC